MPSNWIIAYLVTTIILGCLAHVYAEGYAGLCEEWYDPNHTGWTKPGWLFTCLMLLPILCWAPFLFFYGAASAIDTVLTIQEKIDGPADPGEW